VLVLYAARKYLSTSSREATAAGAEPVLVPASETAESTA